jgi:AcrR family transcriptional regulator
MAAAMERVDPGDRRAAIHAAAIREFSARGYSATSMANIADAAGMSRPALYQYFQNKGDIFASSFEALMDQCVDRALVALATTGALADQLDGFLQRFEGDLWEQMAASPHSQELLDAKYEHAADVGIRPMQRLRKGVTAHLRSLGTPSSRRAESVDVLELAPKGFKTDQPTVVVYRRRLTTLARSVAADIESSLERRGQ